MSKKRIGSSIDDFLKEEGTFEEAQAQAVKEVVAWQSGEAKIAEGNEPSVGTNATGHIPRAKAHVDGEMDCRD